MEEKSANHGEDKIVNGNCWVAYLDLLGFKEYVLSFDSPTNPNCYGVFVEVIYDKILECLKNLDLHPRIFTTWFSDTFLAYTLDDSYESFISIAWGSLYTCAELVVGHHPVRGALGTGLLYAEQKKNIFVGSALIDAYKYGEKQNWIGFAVTPKAEEKFNDIAPEGKTPWTCCDYYKYDVPMKGENGEFHSEKLWAANIEKLSEVRRIITEGANSQGLKDKHKIKYENTLTFLNSIQRKKT